MISFSDSSLKKKEHEEVWRIELPVAYKHKEIKCKSSQDFFGFMIKEGSSPMDETLLLFLYDIIANKYIGFINVSQAIG